MYPKNSHHVSSDWIISMFAGSCTVVWLLRWINLDFDKSMQLFLALIDEIFHAVF